MSMADDIYADGAVIMAPLSGYTDLAFRRGLWRCGCRYAFTPLIEAGSMVYGTALTEKLLLRGAEEPWLGVQLLGSDQQRLRLATQMLNDHDFNLLDFNMGCPVRKVTCRGAGAALSLNREHAARCLEIICAHSRIPVTAKIRIVDADDPAPTVALVQALVGCGVQAVTIHGRLWENKYSGPVATDIIQAVQAAVPVPIISNGGVFDRASCAALRAASGCSRVMIARGGIGNPWLFEQLAEPTAAAPTHTQICAELEQHVEDIVELYGDDSGLRNARKIILAYLAGRGYRRTRRHQVTSLSTLAQFRQFLAEIRAEGPAPRSNCLTAL